MTSSINGVIAVSMCVLRFEVAHELPLPSHLQYQAPKAMDGCGGNVGRSSDSKPSASDTFTQTSKLVAECDRKPREQQQKQQQQQQQQKQTRRRAVATETRNTTVVSDVETVASGPQAAVEQPFELVVGRHRGRRKIHDIVIETHRVDAHPGASTAQSTSESTAAATPASAGGGDKTVNFFSGNPFVEVTKGILHLFKEKHLTSLTEDLPRSEMLCILAVPAEMTSHDLLQFMSPCSPNVGHIRIIRDATPNQYMALIKFRTQAAADEFYAAFNSKRFNSIEPHVCHLVYVASVQATKEFQDGCLPLEGHIELPTCPVCLERMDESVDGILTILCNHSFHGGCLDKWGDTSCPVCRYCQTPEVAADNRCSECGVQESKNADVHESLWICLICGHVGCGRYVEGHAYNHFVETQHTYAMQLGNNRVWDYAGDGYVHRLIQNKTDGKLVEVNDETLASVEQDEKLDSMQLEYTYLLTSQLESQRLYFEEKVMRIEQESCRQVDELVERMKRMTDECVEMKRRTDASGRDKSKIQQLTSKLQKAQTELAEERQMNACLQQNQQEWQTRVRHLERQLERTKTENEAEIQDLKEQLRDVMFYLEAGQTLRNTSADVVTADEVADARIVVGPPASESGGASTSSRGGGAVSGGHRRKRKP